MSNDKTSNKKVKNTVAVSDNEINEISEEKAFINIRNTTDVQELMKKAKEKGNTSSDTKAIKIALINYISNN